MRNVVIRNAKIETISKVTKWQDIFSGYCLWFLVSLLYMYRKFVIWYKNNSHDILDIRISKNVGIDFSWKLYALNMSVQVYFRKLSWYSDFNIMTFQVIMCACVPFLTFRYLLSSTIHVYQYWPFVIFYLIDKSVINIFAFLLNHRS